jgi:hypothetical protein
MKIARLVPAVILMALSVFGDVPQAQAIVGRPLTPVSVAGVARRTARRCAVGVYTCQVEGDRNPQRAIASTPASKVPKPVHS